MSKLEVDTIAPQSGTTITVGEAGDTVDISNATLSANLNATNLTSGTIPDARFPATLPAVNGSQLTGIQIAGGYTICDSITVTNTDTFALTSGGSPVSPESAANCLVSLNGILQAPISSYTISGSNIIFASALVAGSDVIDFITVLGTALNVGTVSDGAITSTKIQDSAVTPVKLGYDYNQYRNIIINGDMSLAQRGTSESGVGASDVYLIDRFQLDTNATPSARFTMSQDTDVPSGQGFSKSLKLDCTTAQTSYSTNQLVAVVQRIEGQFLQYLKYGTSSAESLTLSFWVKSNKTGTYTLELDQAGNGKDYSQTYTISSANTWEKKTLTFNGDTATALANDNTEELEVNFWLAAASDFTSGTLNTSWNSTVNANRVSPSQVNIADSTSNEWYVTGVQLEAGTSASDFEFLPTDVNLSRCLRYYNEINQGNNAGTFTVGGLDGNNGTGICSYTYPVVMRTSPTASYAGTFRFYVAGTGTSKTDLNIQTGSRGFRTLTGSVTGTSGQAVQIDLEDTTVKVKLSAEL